MKIDFDNFAADADELKNILERFSEDEWNTFFEEHFKPVVRQSYYGESCEKLNKVTISETSVYFSFSDNAGKEIGGINFCGFFCYFELGIDRKLVLELESAWKQFLKAKLGKDYIKLCLKWDDIKDLKTSLVEGSEDLTVLDYVDADYDDTPASII